MATDQSYKTPKVFQKTPPKNGLCKMCNINQQLKVAQLANFVPMNEKKFDEEIESYKWVQYGFKILICVSAENSNMSWVWDWSNMLT